jgi:hypothetical protein
VSRKNFHREAFQRALLAKEFKNFVSVCRKSLFIYGEEDEGEVHRGMLDTREGKARESFIKTIIYVV